MPGLPPDIPGPAAWQDYNLCPMVGSAGATGLMIELHHKPAGARVDSPQMVTPDELKDIIDACRTLYRTKKKLVRTYRG